MAESMPCKCHVLVLVLDSEKMKMKTEPSPILCSGEQDLQSEGIIQQLGCREGCCSKSGKDGLPSVFPGSISLSLGEPWSWLLIGEPPLSFDGF